jgi:hypothetical protein
MNARASARDSDGGVQLAPRMSDGECALFETFLRCWRKYLEIGSVDASFRSLAEKPISLQPEFEGRGNRA